MSEHVTGRELGTALLSALGIDPNGVRSLQIDCGVHDAATVTVNRLITKGKSNEVTLVMRRYELTDRAVVEHEAQP